jgi:hypothetical protein
MSKEGNIKYRNEYRRDCNKRCKSFLPGLVLAGREPELSAQTTSQGERQDSSEECETNGSVRHFMPGLRSRLLASDDSTEGHEAGLAPVRGGVNIRESRVLMESSDQVEGRETSPEDQIDEASSLEHATETPEAKAAENWVPGDSVDSGHLDLLVGHLLVSMNLHGNGTRVNISLNGGEESSPLEG